MSFDPGPAGYASVVPAADWLRTIAVELEQLAVSLDERTPQRALEGVADAHHHVMVALTSLRDHANLGPQ